MENLMAALRSQNNIAARDILETRDLLQVKNETISQLEARIKDLMELLHSRSQEAPVIQKSDGDLEQKLNLMREKLTKTEQYYEGQLNIKDNVVFDKPDYQGIKRPSELLEHGHSAKL